MNIEWWLSMVTDYSQITAYDSLPILKTIRDITTNACILTWTWVVLSMCACSIRKMFKLVRMIDRAVGIMHTWVLLSLTTAHTDPQACPSKKAKQWIYACIHTWIGLHNWTGLDIILTSNVMITHLASIVFWLGGQETCSQCQAVYGVT